VGQNSNRISLALYRGRPGFDSLHDEWEDFASRHASHFVHFPAWYGAELERSGDTGVCFLAVRDSRAGLIAVLPIEHRNRSVRGLGAAVPLVQLYYPNEMGVNDVLSREPLLPHWPAIARFLRAEMPFSLLMRWQCVLENGWAVTAAASPSQVRATHQSKYLDFEAGWTVFAERYSQRFRTDLGKKMDRMERLGRLRLSVCSTPAELPAAFEHFLEVEDSGWKGAMGTSIVKQPRCLDYYRYLLSHFGRLGLCRVNLLFLDDLAVAAHFAIEVGNFLYLLKIGFREDFSQFSPGAVLLYKLVRHHCERGPVKAISFVTDVGWIDRWHPSAVQAGVFYTDWDSALGKVAVRLLRWLKREHPAETRASATLR
jgi:hypothetical protein